MAVNLFIKGDITARKVQQEDGSYQWVFYHAYEPRKPIAKQIMNPYCRPQVGTIFLKFDYFYDHATVDDLFDIWFIFKQILKL